MACGLAPREHKNHKRLPHNTLPYECKEHVVTFLQNYAEEHAILLPGRIPGYKRDDLQLLPSSTTKKVGFVLTHIQQLYWQTNLQAVWVLYKHSCEQAGIPAAAYTTFTAYWRQLIPRIVVMKPMTDLCWVCQQNSTAIMRAVNRPDSEKSEVGTYNDSIKNKSYSTFTQVIRTAEAHLTRATKERSYYRTQCQKCKTSLHNIFTENRRFKPPPPFSPFPPMSKPMTVHFSFDMAQQVPYNHE